MKIHRFDTTEDAYDMAQCDEKIKDGDILVAGRMGESVAILVEAWPILVKGPAGEFHAKADGNAPTEQEWEKMDFGKYMKSWKRAVSLTPWQKAART